MKPSMRDAALTKTVALPNGAATTNSAVIDTQNVDGDFLSLVELAIEAPALTTGQAPDGQTVSYHVQDSPVSDFGSGVRNIHNSVIVQTGAGGAGAPAASAQVRLPTQVQRYVRLSCVKTGAADASAKSAVFAPVF